MQEPVRASEVVRSSVMPAAAARPTVRQAGTLILLDETSPVTRILMGQRSQKLAFMPGKFVFPGGRLEAGDLRLAAGLGLPADAASRLLAGTPARFTERHAVAVMLAAVRETYEEAGAMLGTPGKLDGSNPAWSAFAAAGIVPAPATLFPIARAITPPGLPRRFDTRFFCASADSIVSTLSFADRPDPEFDRIGWFSLDEIAALDLPAITRQVLADIEGRLRDGSWRDSSQTMPFYRFLKGRPIREMI
ncbi:NUDIX hydrolase [Aureimonas sp. SA4125]|uniref:NUDIX hydrolase n=1 Tax=Aureimonas sp. SA4125 TaxID=2826993 RepID=UPI001CC34ED3|nr:NUDIX hydrolase [Aureimonas sp. SA4125]BDA84475.1 NUDIX hydrolase [Aureimonas sp. SA4125]